jgi:hypothetical protein
MSLGKCKIEAVDNALYTLLTAGLCDNCKVPKMINTGGDGVHEPTYEELYCKKKEMFIEPQPPEDQVKECDCFEPCSKTLIGATLCYHQLFID